MIYIGIDNGVSGSVGVIGQAGEVDYFGPIPTRTCQDYTKRAKNVSRLDCIRFYYILARFGGTAENTRVFIERPMVNPARFMATGSALRCLEAVLIVLERRMLPVTRYVDSREWQKLMLPAGVKGAADLKRASRDLGLRRWPGFECEIKKVGDADGLFIAECARQNQW